MIRISNSGKHVHETFIYFDAVVHKILIHIWQGHIFQVIPSESVETYQNQVIRIAKRSFVSQVEQGFTVNAV
jgi:hypothetical protein